MRTAFIQTLQKLAEKDPKIFLLNGDVGFSILEEFTKAFPRRSLNMGVSEANMMGVAAGLALSGKTVFVYSIIPFVTARVFEQVRNDIALKKANVKIIGVGSGFSYGQLGPTHHAIEDIALMRSLPDMTVVCPGDPLETSAATKAIAQSQGPVYLRIGKKGDTVVHPKPPPFKLGKGIVIQKGSHCTLIACGNMLPTALAVAKRLEGKGKRAGVLSFPTIKPLDKGLLVKTARETSAIFTLEEHNVTGGLGSAVAEVLAEGKAAIVFRRFGIQDCFTHVAGSQDFLRALHRLSVEDLTKAVLKIIDAK